MNWAGVFGVFAFTKRLIWHVNDTHVDIISIKYFSIE